MEAYKEEMDKSVAVQKRVFEDLKSRGLQIAGFLCTTKEGQIQFLCYDSDGLLQGIYKDDPTSIGVTLYKRNGNGTISEMVTLQKKDKYIKKEKPKVPKPEGPANIKVKESLFKRIFG
jgi:hypothetical protein